MKTFGERQSGLGKMLSHTYLRRSAWACFSRRPHSRREFSVGERRQCLANGVHQHHRARTVARRNRRGRLDVRFGEGGSKRVLAGVLFGVGMAIAAVNFLAWLFPGS